MLSILLSLLSLLSPSSPLEGRDTLRQLSPVEVTTAVSPSQQMATHQQWEMDHHDWQRQGATQLSEALRNLPGVQLRD